MEDIMKLTELIVDLAKKNKFGTERIRVFADDNDLISIEIDGKYWSNQLNYYEAEDQIYNIFKGIELGRK